MAWWFSPLYGGPQDANCAASSFLQGGTSQGGPGVKFLHARKEEALSGSRYSHTQTAHFAKFWNIANKNNKRK